MWCALQKVLVSLPVIRYSSMCCRYAVVQYQSLIVIIWWWSVSFFSFSRQPVWSFQASHVFLLFSQDGNSDGKRKNSFLSYSLFWSHDPKCLKLAMALNFEAYCFWKYCLNSLGQVEFWSSCIWFLSVQHCVLLVSFQNWQSFLQTLLLFCMHYVRFL